MELFCSYPGPVSWNACNTAGLLQVEKRLPTGDNIHSCSEKAPCKIYSDWLYRRCKLFLCFVYFYVEKVREDDRRVTILSKLSLRICQFFISFRKGCKHSQFSKFNYSGKTFSGVTVELLIWILRILFYLLFFFDCFSLAKSTFMLVQRFSWNHSSWLVMFLSLLLSLLTDHSVPQICHETLTRLM